MLLVMLLKLSQIKSHSVVFGYDIGLIPYIKKIAKIIFHHVSKISKRQLITFIYRP